MRLWSNSTVPGNGHFVPEKRLLAAVLQRAVADFLGGEADVKVEAGSWIFSDGDNNDKNDDEDGDAPLTFRFICEALDLECDSLRKAILAQSENAKVEGTESCAIL